MDESYSRSVATNQRKALVNLGAERCGLSELDVIANGRLNLRVGAYSLDAMNYVFMKLR